MANRKYSSASPAYGFTQLTYGRRILLMLCVFVLMMVLSGFAAQLASHIAPPDTRENLLWTSVFQNLIGFAGMAFVTAIFLSTRPLEMLGLARIGKWRSIAGILLIYAVGIPFLNQTILWNTQMHFPESLHSLEETLRGWESMAASKTEVLLNGTSVGTLIVNVLIIGVLTGLCEELAFRGAMQRVIASGGLGSHAAIWLTAIIFSILHFQFFGFLPRVLLGAFFGYLFYWTGSIWISATAHAINNSIYVITTWMVANGYATPKIEGFGVTEHGFPVFACVSLCLVLFVMVGMRKYLFSTTSHG